MLSFDKAKIGVKVFTNELWRQLVYWVISFNLFVFFTGNVSFFVNYLNFFDLGIDIRQYDSPYFNIVVLSILVTAVFMLIDNLAFKLLFNRLPVGIVLIARTMVNFLLGLCIIVISANPIARIIAVRDWSAAMDLVPEWNIHFIRFLVFFFLAVHFYNLYSGIFKKIGRSNRSKWILGGMNTLREETRIFMFIDMKDSTRKAESLGHKKFSQLVQDVFNDMSVVDNYGGEIYQYLGDGAIVSWSLNEGMRNFNCIKAFFAVQNVVNKQSVLYKLRYGDVPEFKAGIHMGKTMVLQVGKVRRDISYNGDTLNTTARIESMCNVYRHNLLISGVLFERLDPEGPYAFKEIENGKVKLKGKKGTIQLYGVKPKEKTKKKTKRA